LKSKFSEMAPIKASKYPETISEITWKPTPKKET
jgi:hypothetical protein